MLIEVLKIVYELTKQYFTVIVAFLGGLVSPIMPYYNYMQSKIAIIVDSIAQRPLNLDYRELLITLFTVFLSAIVAGLGAFTIQTILNILHEHVFLRVFPKLKTNKNDKS